MYDVVVIGQGLSGMLSAIWAKEQGYHTALVAAGTGRIMQSSGVMDIVPGSDKGWKEFQQHFMETGAIDQFKKLTERLGYPYQGDLENLTPIMTGAGHVKMTALYPATISRLPEQGHVVVVGFQEMIDFQPDYIKGNLQKARPNLAIETVKIQLGKQSQRTMTQLDAARLLDRKEIRDHCMTEIKRVMKEKGIARPNLFIFPASLGVENWLETITHFSAELEAVVTEAPGMPPNTTAIRLNERLKKEAVKLGVRFYEDTTVVDCTMDGEELRSLTIRNGHKLMELSGKQFILATGGVLGGGLEITSGGLKETALGLETDEFGALLDCPVNLYPVGAANGTKVTKVTYCGITGGVYSIVSTYEAVGNLCRNLLIGGTRSA